MVNRKWSNSTFLVLGAWLLCACLWSCQTIPADERLVPVEASEIRSDRTTLICEFSGYRCTNCPNAAEEAHRMLSVWPDNLVVVEMHPPSNSFTRYNKEEFNYTCAAADVYYQHYEGWKSVGFPTGIINLTGDFTDYHSWGGAYVNSALAGQKTSLRIVPEVRYDASSRTLSASVEFTSDDELDTDLRLVAWLTEDSILGGQLMPDGSSNMAYYHNHLLRDTLTAAWGEALPLHTARALEAYVLDEKFNASQCHLVLLALRDDEVVQAKQVPVVQP